MFKLKEIMVGLIISALIPILLLVFLNYNSTTVVENADGSVTQTATWVSFSVTSYLFTVVCMLILYMIISTAIKLLRKKWR
ncbi:hypothetical protein [Paenibacillus lignilyticus]|uniref:Uncharacterized protein n=1 Tax=Paenibacillus lignilyticus TaxID=1172615 RepID=A0ABS5CA53_9BACL|nr:hypothetical protein [Paenibacillus lignilyticus]MBP3962867.1 hypothetical protein [Paenibacillus lignilyticus]